MRKAQKEQLLEILQTLREAHKEIKRYISRRELEMACALLGECQQSALQIGGLIEESEGEDCLAVHALEDYCEELYQISQSVSEKNFAKKAAARMHKALAQVEDCVKRGIAVRTEIVFLSYKASMFDSFESVWRAAEADPDCDAYVIPIPYYDKNPDGSFREMRYEGGQYPKDIPVIQYQDYDFAKRRPDAVFIHNGYDDCNYVTSVHPNFYSTELKKYSGRLIYIPYFVSVSSVSPHMCIAPGCLNADRVFVQSEKIRRQYIDALQEAYGKDFSRKVAALGSPKFDKAILSKPDEYDLPAQWRQIINRPDGTRKKIFLYNTTITVALQENERYLVKLRFVLELFRRRSDVVLWWRPHPLLEATFRSMRPGLLAEYLQMVADYQREGWGIFDDSADSNRAVAYADYYYGDSGSALQASFHAAGKPIMTQRIAPADTSLAVPLILGTDGTRLFFSPSRSSCILSFDVESYDVKLVRPGCPVRRERYFLGSELEGKLYFTPLAADTVLVMDLKTDQFQSIPYDVNEKHLLRLNPRYVNGSNFSWSFARGDNVFFVGNYREIMCLNTRSNQITYIADWPPEFLNGNSYAVVRWCCQMDSRIVLCGDGPVIALFDMDSMCFSTETISHECAMNGYSTVAYGDGFLWLLEKTNTCVLRFDPRSKEVFAYDRFPEGVLCRESACAFSLYTHGSLWLFFHNANAVLRLCGETGDVSVVRLFPDGTPSGVIRHIGVPLLMGSKIYVSRSEAPGFTVYDAETGAYSDIQARLSDDVVKAFGDYSSDLLFENIEEAVISESVGDPIDILLHAEVKNREKLLADWIASPDGKAGERIYRHVKDLILSD